MADKIWYFVMVPMVYVAVIWSVIWITVRLVTVFKAPDFPRTLRLFPEGYVSGGSRPGGLGMALWDTFTMPSIREHQPVFWFFLMVFHAAFAVLILAHLDILPQVNIMSKDSEHMIGNGAVGILVTISLLYFMFRRFASPVREVSVPADYFLLFLMLCIAVSGDVISWGNSWSEAGFVMTKKDFGLYLDNLIRFTFADPRQYLSGSHYAVIGAHVLLANLFLILLPFSKIMHVFFAVPMNRMRRG